MTVIHVNEEGPFYLVLPNDLNEDDLQVFLLSSTSLSLRSNLIQKYPKPSSLSSSFSPSTQAVSSQISQSTSSSSFSPYTQTVFSKISQSTSLSFFLPSKLANLKVKIPVIRLPISVADLLRLSRQPLDENERDLKVENEKLKAHVEKLEMQLNKIFLELKEFQNLNEILIVINEEFEKENNDLYKKLEIYKHLRKLRIVKERKSTHKYTKSNEYESEYKERIFIHNLDGNEADLKDYPS
ncbi:hypothetical protein C1646_772243 [Rhizophagus diaphanus]|nr:hypothetical protein C1646_772243 [Rhizophagus diaphanus] [Rhizophagus sp. MUCL 43196]